MDSIHVGDNVLSWHPANGRLESRRVCQVRSYNGGVVASITFSPERIKFRATPHHTVFTSRGWKRVSKLRCGDEVLVTDGGPCSFACVAHVAMSDKLEPVYNLITEREHNFIVGGVVAHNFTVLRNRAYLC